jgi:hypothetical protein
VYSKELTHKASKCHFLITDIMSNCHLKRVLQAGFEHLQLNDRIAVRLKFETLAYKTLVSFEAYFKPNPDDNEWEWLGEYPGQTSERDGEVIASLREYVLSFCDARSDPGWPDYAFCGEQNIPTLVFDARRVVAGIAKAFGAGAYMSTIPQDNGNYIVRLTILKNADQLIPEAGNRFDHEFS